MPTARTETTARKSASATAARAGGPLPGTSTQAFTTGTILPELYRDTSHHSPVGKNGHNLTAVITHGEPKFLAPPDSRHAMSSFDHLRLLSSSQLPTTTH